MAGEAYQVDYIINLQDRASAGIANFSKAASKLTAAAENLKKFEATFNNIVGKFSKPLKMSIDTANAHRSLDKILKKIQRIQTEARKVNVGVVGNPAGNGSGRGGGGNRQAPVVAPVRRQAPRPLVGSRAGQPLVPRNLEYQVLGPTRLGNVAMLDMFKGMGLMYGISAIGSGIRDIISQSTDYENIMQTAKNILKTNYKGGNFNANFIDLERIAREVGVETKFTAPEVADAVKFLAMAGLDLNAIKKSIRPIADIALIGDTDLGQTADVMTNIMTAYGIKPEDMRKTADVMTRTFTMSNTTLMELAESFKMSGSMLHLANVPFETAAAAFGVLGDAGIKATMAGTTMRTIMNNLRNPTKNQQKYWDMLGVRRYDDYGNLREINDIFADLNKLNGNDARSAKAREQYEALQKQYAPKFEGLQEGSEEWNKLTAEYDKASEEIRRKFGGVDVFRLFRLTAASGAGVLMNSVEKWNRVIEENFLSQGLSERLAEEKKNTIAGMWAQLKSAFQEGGLKVFEENDGKIRGYLQRGISWLKSTEFTDLLRSVFDLVADLGNTLLWFTKHIVTFYDRFKPLINGFLKFQLILKGIQLLVGSGKMVGNALLYTLQPFMNAAIGSPWIQRKMPGVFGLSMAATGQMASASAYNGMLNGMNPLIAWWFTGRKGKGMPLAPVTIPKQTLAPYIRPKMPMDPTQISLLGPVMSQQANAVYTKQLAAYNKRVARANNMQRNAGWSGMAGAVVGSYLGNAIAPDSDWAGAIGGIAGSLGGIALSSMAIPGARLITAGVMGAAAATAAIIKHIRAVREAKEAADLYVESMKKLDVESWSIGSQQDYFVSTMRVRGNVLLSEQSRLNASIELWRKYYRAMNGEEEEANPSAKGYMYDNDSNFKTLVDRLTGKGSNAFQNELYAQLVANGDYAKAEQALQDMFGDEINGYGTPSWQELLGMGFGIAEYHNNLYKSLTDDNGLLLAASAMHPENKIISQDIGQWLENAYKGIGNEQDVERRIAEFQKKFMTPAGEIMSFSQQAELPIEDYKTMSHAELLQNPTYYALMVPQLQKILDEYREKASAFFSDNEASAQSSVISNYMQQIFGGIGENVGTFGDDTFKAAFDTWLNTVPIDAKERELMPQTAFANALKIFESLPDAQKKYILPVLNRNYWEDVLGVDLTNIEGGFNAPTESTPNPYGDMFNWNAEKGIWELEGMPSLPGIWNYKPVGPVMPEATNNTATNGNATVAMGGGFNSWFYHPAWEQSDSVPPLNNDAFRPSERRMMYDTFAQATVNRPINIYINSDALIKADKIDAEADEGKLQEKVHDSLVNILDDVAGMFGGQFNTGVA